ncbi:MAG TPA: tetratricopeptide repeat protein [Cyclobacteriaceae bacterium]|nr:tetratricopeptide repeat protein [Cyclobacteriaceae bacterium]
MIAIGQGGKIDSLEQKLRSALEKDRVDILNQLTYEFISVDNVKVTRYGSEAIQLAKRIGYTKGEGIAHTYRGVYEYQSGQFAEARESLHKGLRLSQQAGDRLNEGYTFLQLGNAGLEEVNMDSAYIYLRKAYSIFKDSSHAENLSKVYRNLSALFGQRFQPDSQQYYLDKAIAIRRLLPDQSYLVDALAIQANNKLFTGNLNAAEKLLDEADHILARYPNDLENLNDVKHIRALILFQRGKFEDGEALFDSARNYYFKMDLFRKYVTLLIDLAKIFSDRGDYELALNNLYDALQLSKLKNFETETYIIRTKIGWINFLLGDYDQALRLANESLRARPAKLLKADLAHSLTLKAVVLTELGQLKEARAALDTVFILHSGAGNKQGLSEAYLNLGAIESKLDNFESSLMLYRKSIILADSANYLYGNAWSNWGIADIFYRQQKYVQALYHLNESEKYSRLIHANELLVLCYNTRRDILKATGKFKEALIYSMMASQLKDSLHRSDIARRFVNLEKIQEIEQRDRNIKVLEQQKQMADDKIKLQESRLRQQYSLIFAGVLIISLLTAFYWRIRKLNVTITEKNNAINQVNLELNVLYNEVSEKNEEIQAQSQKLADTNKSIVDLNRSLEQLIAEKTLELRKTNDELVKHNNELLQFSYTVSHNLRGPVARLLGLSSLMITEKDTNQAKQWVNLISKTTGELDVIIKDLSKILELRREPHHFRDHVDLAAEWQKSINLLADSLTGTEQITADFQSLRVLVTVRAMVQSVFYNLLSNALKFRSPDRPLEIGASSEIIGEFAIITVTDNGLGFDMDLYKDKIFRLYTRFHSHVEGRGLGLYLIKSQLEVVRGSIAVQSTPGKGTRFQVTIPLSSELK